ncbi:hypothetical protein GCM10010359_60880 [Streptomyces morookaense]|nr:hypothetical protein GCM10010359_60880 [Streptomyces morookaense]
MHACMTSARQGAGNCATSHNAPADDELPRGGALRLERPGRPLRVRLAQGVQPVPLPGRDQ